jgi:hypothetical protein
MSVAAGSNEKLYIVTCVFNPESYKSRYRLYNNFAEYINKFENAELWTVELAFEGQEFAVTQADCPRHIQLKTNEVLWYKENLLNIGISRLPADAKYIAWIDADIDFVEEDWVEKTIAALNEHTMVQMFKVANDLGPDEEIITSAKSFVYKWLKNESTDNNRGRSGLAWAATREALDSVGKLIDWGIVGSGDWFMAFAATDQITKGNLDKKTGGYSGEALKDWAARCETHINKNVGFVNLTLNHHWHGKKSNRGYNWRWQILSENQFNPLTDLDYHPNGLIKLRTHKPKLLEGIKNYFQSRDEDDTEK